MRHGGAHPRVSGENKVVALNQLINDGSSPRERGKLVRRLEEVTDEGLIPA